MTDGDRLIWSNYGLDYADWKEGLEEAYPELTDEERYLLMYEINGDYLYEVRHDDDQQGDPVQIGRWIMINHWGTLISNKPIKLEPSPGIDNAYRDIDPENDWNYDGEDVTIQKYMAEHPPEKPKRIEHERL